MSPTVHRQTTPSPRAALRSHPEREVPEEAPAILGAGIVAHVGFETEGQPYVIPMTYHYDPAEPRRLYLHGAYMSRLMEHLATGGPVCVAVTLIDGLVYSRTALYHSVNYRSIVCFGRAGETPDTGRQREVLEGMIGRYFPGRQPGRDYEPIPQAHVEGTAFLALDIEEWSAKVRRGGPKGPRDADPLAPGSAGLVPLSPL